MSRLSPTRVTLNDVAQRAGVSRSAASYILRRTEPYFSRYAAETIKRVEQAAAQIGYVPNLLATSLSLQRLPYFGVFFEFVRSGDPGEAGNQSSMMWQAYEGIAHTALEHQRYPVVLTSPGPDESLAGSPKALDQLVRAGLSGVIGAVHTETWNNHLARWDATGIPCISLYDPGDDEHRRWYVDLDNHAVGQMAWDHLAGNGHRRILCLYQEEPGQAVLDRISAFQSAQADSGTEPHSFEIKWSGGGIYRIEDRERNLFIDALKKSKATAIFCPDAGACMVAHETFQLFGIDVPGDYSLVGIDLPIWSPAVQEITQIACPDTTVGHEAARLLMERLAGAPAEPKHVLVKPVLQERTSVAAV